MATLLIAAPVVHSTALRSHATVLRGLQARKTLRVSCRRASVSSASGDNGSCQDEVAVLQSSSTRNPPLTDWISIFFEKEVVHDQAVPHAVAAPTFQLLEPATELIKTTELPPRVPRRSERTVIFTEEKARRLRKENRATQPFHDKWYHSAIASRLAIPE